MTKEECKSALEDGEVVDVREGIFYISQFTSGRVLGFCHEGIQCCSDEWDSFEEMWKELGEEITKVGRIA